MPQISGCIGGSVIGSISQMKEIPTKIRIMADYGDDFAWDQNGVNIIFPVCPKWRK